MNQREKEVLKLIEDFSDTLENELIKSQRKDRKIVIKDIKLVGQVNWQDKTNGEPISENVFLVEREIKEFDKNGNERISEQKSYYLGDECIGGKLGTGEVLYKKSFEDYYPNKANEVKQLINRTSEQDIESNSLENLRTKEISEILTAHFGKEISQEEAKKMVADMNEQELKELQKEKEEKEDNDENQLSEKQTDKIKVNGIQKADLNKLVDGKETLGSRLDLQEYDTLYVVYSEKVNEITSGSKINNTTYSLVGMTKDGEARLLNDEFEMDKTVGNSGGRETTKIKADSTATRDNKDISVYTRKSNGMSIGCENNQGNVDMFLYQKTAEENENVGIQIETSKTPVIPIEIRDIMNRNKGIYQKERVQDEIQEHTEDECKLDDIKDFDGNEDTFTHQHLSDVEIDRYVTEIFNYKNQYGEEKIKEVFTEREVKDKFIEEIEKAKENGEENITVEQIVEKVQEELNNDAEMLGREHKR